ncbi:MAG: hypothetical protein HYZ34_05950 [Ignavibacteriae bacterium]|nr:hypothetical protein [Ignavibacteriota bacterium]
MKLTPLQRRAIDSVISGEYTPYDLREFFRICYILARPLIHKKISIGKINVHILGLHEADIITDCLADLFSRDELGKFPVVMSFVKNHLPDSSHASNEELLMILSYLVIGQVNQNIARLYNESDPTLGKILRNLKAILERTTLFESNTRFSEPYLFARNSEYLSHLPPIPMEIVRREFSHVVSVHDSIEEMVKRLHTLLVNQHSYQRIVPLIDTALLLKEVYTVAWKTEEKLAEIVEPDIANGDIARVAEEVCKKLFKELYPTYVEGNKCTESMYRNYFQALQTVLSGEFGDGSKMKLSYFDCLKLSNPDLTKEEYKHQHRSTMEYLGKLAKTRMKALLNES